MRRPARLVLLLLALVPVMPFGSPVSADVIYTGFGPGGTYNGSSGHHVSAGAYGECDVAGGFTVAPSSDYYLSSIQLGVLHFLGINTLDVWLVGSRLGTNGDITWSEPDETVVLEYFRLTGVVPQVGHGAPVTVIESVLHPLLEAGSQYCVVLSAPESGSYFMWYSGLTTHEAAWSSAVRDQSVDWGVSYGSYSSAFQIEGTPCSEFPGGGETEGCYPGEGHGGEFVPDPASTLLLLGMGLAVAGLARRRWR